MTSMHDTRSRSMAPHGILIASTILSFAIGAFGGQGMLARRADTPNWDSIQPCTSLSWTACYGTLQCARFQVPLHYSEPLGNQSAIALVMAPSNLSKDDQNYRGPVLFNPGGPGDSGVDFVVENVATFRQILGPQFDLVGFDPRGVGATTPPISIFKDGLEADKFYSSLVGNVNESTSSFGELYAQRQNFGELAHSRAKDVIESVSTPAVAQDMMSIIKAFGQEKLQYWGISYGTVLGATFASMFPNNIERMILDGVVNAHDYYAGNWSSVILDTEQAFTRYLDACVEAGPSACPIHENTTELVRARIEHLADKLHLNPLPVFNDSDTSNIKFGTVGYTDLTNSIFQMLYGPTARGAPAAEAFPIIEQGDGSMLFKDFPFLEDLCIGNKSEPFVAGQDEIRASIACSDRINSSRYSLEQMQQAYQDELAISPTFAPVAHVMFSGLCSGWNIGGADRFNASLEQNTSFPILFLSNTADPVTPKANAYNMSSGFAGSVVVEQDTIGHGSLTNFANCTFQAVRGYFINGTMPNPGTICPVESTIFGSNATTSANSTGTSGA